MIFIPFITTESTHPLTVMSLTSSLDIEVEVVRLKFVVAEADIDVVD